MRNLIEKAQGIHQSAIKKAKRLDDVDPDLAKVIVVSGTKDGDLEDDKVNVNKASWFAADLKPSQTTMVLEKAIGMALQMIKSGNIGGELGAIVSSDNYIMDGHHRWAATILAGGSKGKVGGVRANIEGKRLQPILNVITKGLFGIGRGKKGKGSIDKFTSANVKKMLKDMLEKGIPGDFSKSADEVDALLTKAFGSSEKGVEKMADNLKLMNKKIPSWAPSKEQMPVVRPNKIPETIKKLSGGHVDHTAPFKEDFDMGWMKNIIERIGN
jgi:hypothetical protein